MAWRNLGDPSRREINEVSFSGWYKKMMKVIKVIERVPRSILDEYLSVILFGVSHGSTWVSVHCVQPHIFQMRSQKFTLTIEAFHTEVSLWPRITRKIGEGKHIHFFDGMVPQPLPREKILERNHRQHWGLNRFSFHLR